MSCLSSDVPHEQGRLILTWTFVRLTSQEAVRKLSGNIHFQTPEREVSDENQEACHQLISSLLSHLTGMLLGWEEIMAHFCAPVQIITPTS